MKTIINDVDVFECENRLEEISCVRCWNYPVTDYTGEIKYYELCEKKPDCYFKQLKRLQAKYDKLQEELNEHKKTE